MKAPKSILNHKSVKAVVDAKSIGFDDYKYNVELKDGWVFAYGRNAGFNMCNFNTVSEFKYCEPVKQENYIQR